MPAKDTDLAWFAGFVDGEGTIGISRTNGKNWKRAYLRPLLQASNTDRRAVEEMARIAEQVTGKRASIVSCSKPNERWKQAWRVKISTQWELLLLLPAIMPHLRLKGRQAELALDFCKRKLGRNGKSGYRWNEFREADEAAYNECVSLNARGVALESAQIHELKPVKEA